MATLDAVTGQWLDRLFASSLDDFFKKVIGACMAGTSEAISTFANEVEPSLEDADPQETDLEEKDLRDFGAVLTDYTDPEQRWQNAKVVVIWAYLAHFVKVNEPDRYAEVLELAEEVLGEPSPPALEVIEARQSFELDHLGHSWFLNRVIAAAYEAALGREPSEAVGLLAVVPWLKAWTAGQNYFNECMDKYLEADVPTL